MAAHIRKFVILAVIMFLCAATILTQHAYSAFTASIMNSGNTFGSGTTFMTVKSGTTSLCTSVPSGSTVPSTSNFDCTGSLIPATVPTTQVNTQTDFYASGTASFASAALGVLSCTPSAYSNTVRPGGPMLVHGGASWQVAGPNSLSGSSAAGFNGTDTAGTGVLGATAAQVFSEGVWFKTTAKQGTIAAWSNGTGISNITQSDRMLYLDANGYLNWGTYGNSAYQVITGSVNVADGNWHYAVGTATTDGTNATINLYTDGALTATKTFSGATSAQSNTGYWRVGQSISTSAGWNGNGQYFSGSISNFTIFNSVLSASTVTGLYNTTSQSGYVTAAQAAGATDLWALGDPKTFTTTILPASTANPCAHVDVVFGSTTVPMTYAVGQSQAITVPAPGSSTAVVIGLKRDSAYTSGFDTGLHLIIPFRATMKGFPQNFNWSTMDTTL